MKLLSLLFIILFSFPIRLDLLAQEAALSILKISTPTDNVGQGKFDRINHIEKKLIESLAEINKNFELLAKTQEKNFKDFSDYKEITEQNILVLKTSNEALSSEIALLKEQIQTLTQDIAKIKAQDYTIDQGNNSGTNVP